MPLDNAVYSKRFLDKEYLEQEYPPLEYRYLALFRLWNAVQYFFPYKDQLETPWERTLRQHLPK